MLNREEINELKRYVKKIKKEGSTTAGAPGYLSAKAFSGEEGGEGTARVDLEDDQYAYSVKAPKTNIHSVKLHEASYKSFREDQSQSTRQKINKTILEMSKKLREVSQQLDHSLKLKAETSFDNSQYWKKTNEAILKLNRRLAEVSKKAKKLANINEIAANQVKDKLKKLLSTTDLASSTIEYNTVGADDYEFDIYYNGEPYAIDFTNGQFYGQDVNKEIDLGNFDDEQSLVKNITNFIHGQTSA